MLEFCFIGASMKFGAYDAQGRRKYLNKTENRRFLAAVEELDASKAVFCRAIYYTGCRISEALNLTGDDIDWATHVIRFRTLKKRGKIHARRVPIPSELTKSLHRIGPESPEERIWPFSRSTGWRIVKGVMQTAGISGIHATAKGLRHGFGVRAALAGVPVNNLRDWLGHSDSSTTAIYMDIRDDEERQLIKRTWKL